MLIGPVAFMPLVPSTSIMVEAHGGQNLLASWQPGNREIAFTTKILSLNPLNYQSINGLIHAWNESPHDS
jgi:hypothetical protein